MNIIPFDFSGQPVRVATIDNEPFWVAADVARVLVIAEIRSTLRTFSPTEKGVHTVHTPGGAQKMLMVSEAHSNEPVPTTAEKKEGAA